MYEKESLSSSLNKQIPRRAMRVTSGSGLLFRQNKGCHPALLLRLPHLRVSRPYPPLHTPAHVRACMHTHTHSTLLGKHTSSKTARPVWNQPGKSGLAIRTINRLKAVSGSREVLLSAARGGEPLFFCCRTLVPARKLGQAPSHSCF